MAVRRNRAADGVIADARGDEGGQVMVRVRPDGVILDVLVARGTFPAGVVLSREDAAELAREILKDA